ncbi:hypothetical protein ACWEKT_34515 [Nocardia takedensis]
MSDSSSPMDETAASPERQRGLHLVLAAFDEARATGRDNWQSMTVAVLKNRLLNSTNREFQESDFGVESIVEFVKLYPGELELDLAARPPIVTLLTPKSLPSQPMFASSNDHMLPEGRIRSDLWQAFVDYRSGYTYYWDPKEGVARATELDDTDLTVPTITADEVTNWRTEFIDTFAMESRQEETILRLNEWKSRGYSSGFLPAELRASWNKFFRNKVLENIQNFFVQNDLSQPIDLITRTTAKTSSPNRDTDGHSRSLRALVHRCVAVMTERELEELHISAAVYLRASRDRL